MADFVSRLKLRFKDCGHFVHDKENKTYCKKTGSSWAIVVTIYLTYFVCVLIAFFCGLHFIKSFVIKQGISGQFDKRMLLPHNTPKLNVFPRLAGTTLLWYTDEVNNSEIITADHYIKYLDNFFKRYENLDPNIYVNCSDHAVNSKGKFCRFTKDMLGPCGKSGYGYHEGKPCIFLKLNRMRHWTPWDKAQVTGGSKPSIHEGEETDFAVGARRAKPRFLTPICKPTTTFGCDRMGFIDIYPKEAFQEYYFPFNGSDLYLSPLAAVQFADIIRGFVVSISCEIAGMTSIPHVQNMLRTTLYLYINEGDEV